VRVTISCPDEPCRAVATGSLRIPRIGPARARTITTRAPATTIAKGAKATIGLRLSRDARASIRRALRAHRRIVVKLAIRVTDAAGNARPLTRRVALRLPPGA
jgi:hypothetical protein